MTDYVNVWHTIISDPHKSWVLFENGTCVILMEPEDDLSKHAQKLLSEYGPVFAGSSFGDMNVIDLQNFPGWVVVGHHRDILNYVSPDEVETENAQAATKMNLATGLIGRQHRHVDAANLKVVYINDKRQV